MAPKIPAGFKKVTRTLLERKPAKPRKVKSKTKRKRKPGKGNKSSK